MGYGHKGVLTGEDSFGLSPPAPISVASPSVLIVQLGGIVPSNGVRSTNNALKSVAAC